MNGYHHFIYVLNVLIPDLLRMLDIVSDLIYVDVTVLDVLRWKPSCCIFGLRQELLVPPFNFRQRV